MQNYIYFIPKKDLQNFEQYWQERCEGAILEYPAIFFHCINLWIPQSRSRKLSKIQGMCN